MTISIFPVINLNGTDGHALLQENMDAYYAVQAAIDALSKVTVHGRDYQTITDIHNATTTAIREHVERLAKLESVRDELAAMATSISEQLQERRRS